MAEVEYHCQSTYSQVVHYSWIKDYVEFWTILVLLQQLLYALNSNSSDDRVGQLIVKIEQKLRKHPHVLLPLKTFEFYLIHFLLS